jgi:hypothetical protein
MSHQGQIWTRVIATSTEHVRGRAEADEVVTLLHGYVEARLALLSGGNERAHDQLRIALIARLSAQMRER